MSENHNQIANEVVRKISSHLEIRVTQQGKTTKSPYKLWEEREEGNFCTSPNLARPNNPDRVVSNREKFGTSKLGARRNQTAPPWSSFSASTYRASR